MRRPPDAQHTPSPAGTGLRPKARQGVRAPFEQLIKRADSRLERQIARLKQNTLGGVGKRYSKKVGHMLLSAGIRKLEQQHHGKLTPRFSLRGCDSRKVESF